MPPSVAIVSDTTGYLPAELVSENEIRLVSLYVNWEDRSERELVLAGARAAKAGAGVDEVVERIRSAQAGLKMWFAIDTLEYLRRGGRIGAASAWLGSALKIKPILTLDKEITPVERVRTGTRA